MAVAVGFTQGLVSGSNFSASGGGQNLEGYGMAPCLHIFYVGDDLHGCASGDVLQLSATSGQWTTGDMWGSMTVEGQSHSFDFLSTGEFVFTAGSVILPYSEDPRIRVTAPFTMTGFLVARDSTGSVGLALSGSGTVGMNLNNMGVDSSGNRVYRLEGISYTFQPTPEPATIILLGTGLLGVASMALRRRR